MARVRRATRFVAVIAVGMMAILAVLIVWLYARPVVPRGPAPLDAETVLGRPPATDDPEVPPPSPRPEPPPEPPRVVGAVIPGTSPLARRLAIGDLLWKLRAHPDAALVRRLDGVIAALEPHLLEADNFEEWRRTPASRGDFAALAYLTAPRRDTDTLLLAGAAQDDRYGKKMLVRIWTLGEEYPPDDLEFARAVMRHWLDVADCSGEGGFDVIVTPEMGRDVFPAQSGPGWAVGVYFHDDEYCVAYSTLPRHWRRRVVQHELAHALWRRLDRRFTDSRLISEGLAEFFEHSEPGDRGLRYGVSRFKDEMAALHAMLEGLEAGGARFASDTVQRMLNLRPRNFYALRHLGYLVGLAAIGYAGGECVEAALRARSDRPLREVLDTLEWATLREYVARAAGHGHAERAFVIEDVGPGHDGVDAGKWRKSRVSVSDAWRSIGATGSFRAERLVTPRAGSPLDWNVVGAVIKSLFETKAPTVFVTDVSRAMYDELDLRPWSTEFSPLDYEQVKAETPHDFMTKLWLLASDRAGKIPVLPLADMNPRRLKLTEVHEHTGYAVPNWMRRDREPLERVVLCTAGGPVVEGDVEARWRELDSDPRARAALEVFRKLYPRGPEIALVIDLGSQPTEYALHWTYVLAAASGFQNPVAYWNPSLPRR